jgi:preprotein translocase subunit YajC
LLLLALVLVAMMVFSRRNRQRAAAADALRRERITSGTDVMTTSGLYGTVVAVNDDGTVLLSVAPGVEVRWTVAALREVSELPEQYREPIAGPADAPGSPAGEEPPSAPARPSAARAANPASRRPRRRGASPG